MGCLVTNFSDSKPRHFLIVSFIPGISLWNGEVYFYLDLTGLFQSDRNAVAILNILKKNKIKKDKNKSNTDGTGLISH